MIISARRIAARCALMGLLVPVIAGASIDAPAISAIALTDAPMLDGHVHDDPAWQAAPVASGFRQTRPNEGKFASQRTEVRVGYTVDALYIGVICFDTQPEAIIVSDSRRDSALEDTDSFLVIIDSFLDRQNGLVFGTNPAGLEYDGQLIAEGEGGLNLNWDTNWSVQSQIFEDGWSAEFEIPFKSLRYGSGQRQTWGMNFQRNIRRNNEEVYWSPLPRQHDLYRVSLAGKVEGIEVPRQRNLKLTPYALASFERGGDLPPGTTGNEEVGFDLKYSLTPSLTLDATYNTDFAQVEVDEIQVNLNRFSLFFPEKRPFFLENAGQFAVGASEEVELFFSRRIGVGEGGAQLPIEAGLRLSGKVGENTNVGFLQMRSEAVEGVSPRNDFTVVRVNQELAKRSSFGAILVNRAGDGSHDRDEANDYNRSYGLDGRWGIGEEILVSGFAAKTETPGRRAKDHAYKIAINQDTENWANSIAYTEVGGDFNPEVGFLRRDAYRKGQFGLFRRIRPDNLWGLQELRPHMSYSGFWDLDGFQESGFLHIDNHWEWKSGHEIHTGINFSHEGVKMPFNIVDGVTVEPGAYDNEELSLYFQTNRGAPVSFDLSTTIGGLFGGDRVSLRPTVRFRQSEKFRAELSWDYNDIDLPVENGDFRINLGRLRVSYSFTPKISVQTLVQYDDRSDRIATNLRFAWLQTANAGLYLVYNEVDVDGVGGFEKPQKQVILKYGRIFDLLQ